jgi:peptidoglycan/xylan/chitin deacetylase (PgdA/CDA1 family)
MFVTLSYHIINHAIQDKIAISEAAFEQQLAYLREHGYTTLSLAQTIADIDGSQKAPPRSLLLTFDDGYADNIQMAMPLLRAYDMRATLFVMTGYIGQNNRWNLRACYDVQHMTWDELRHWHESGGDIGGHSHLHYCMTRLSFDELQETVLLNKHLLANEIGVTPRAFAYPYGRFNQAVIDIIRQHYEIAFATDGGAWNTNAQRYTINRLSVSPTWAIEDFASQIQAIHLNAHALESTN